MTVTVRNPCLECQVHIDYAEQLIQDLEQVNYRLRRVERENYRLRNAREDAAAKRSATFMQEAKEFLTVWDDLRRQYFTEGRKVILDPMGSRGKRYQEARKLWSHEDLMKCVKGLALSDFHTQDREYFEPKSFLKDDERIAKHIERWDAAEVLRNSGFEDESFIRNAVQRAVKPMKIEFGGLACPACSSDPCSCGSESERNGSF